ncbi:uncharacterized protein LOC114525338 [Dendronephthya gigantea]|uniref:uncharacterized protein LOC114525338 n=1 Tax=Dendronephthya gigantea TaxID=151771 RepID=UPI001069A365|nr:uncharacterized protein LOC114525338 [Dendronephthya gigantea]
MISFPNILSIFIVLYWQECNRPTTGYYLDNGKIEGQQFSSIWPEVKVPNAYTGQFYRTTIASSSLRDYNIRFLVSAVGSQNLPKWLTYDDEDYSLTGIPLSSDAGSYQLFVVAMRCNKTSRTTENELLGAQNFEINVLRSQNLSYCNNNANFIATQVSLSVNATQLNSTQRIELFHWFVTEFDLSANRTASLYFKHEYEPKNISHTGCDILETFEANTSYSGPVLTISWLEGCDLNVSTNMSDITARLNRTVLDYPVFSWKVLNGNDSTSCLLGVQRSIVASSADFDAHRSTTASLIHHSMLVRYVSVQITNVTTTTPSSSVLSAIDQEKPSFVSSLGISTSINAASPHPVVINTTPRFNSTNPLHGMSISSTLYRISTRTSLVHINISPSKSEVVLKTTHSTSLAVNTDPVVQRPLATLNITSCQYLYYKIPKDTFWDKEDGNNLTLRLLTESFRELSIDSWVSFDPTRNIVYGIPVSPEIFANNLTRVDFEYILSAVDSSGREVNASLTLTVYDDHTPSGQEISIEVRDALTQFNLVRLFEDIIGYLYNGDKSTMKILNLNQTSTKTQLTWSDCKAVTDVCDARRVERTLNLIRIDESFLNPHFVIALVPNVLLDARAKKLGMCLNEAPVARGEDIRLNITCCERFSYAIPPDLFHDKEDGNTRNLSLSIRYTSASRSPSETWIMLNDTAKTIEGVIALDEAQKRSGLVFEQFYIIATDSGRLEANASVTITVLQPLPTSNYQVSLFLKRLHSFSTQLEEILNIIQKLSLYFKGVTSDEVRVLSYSRENTVTVFKWSLAGLRLKPCDSLAIANISQKLKAADGRQAIYGLPDEAALQAQPSGGYRYVLVGQDSGGRIASSVVVVYLPETAQPYNYRISANLRSYIDASLPCVDHVIEFLKKLSLFLGEDTDRIRVISYNISKTYPADVTVSWTNQSANFNTCDHKMIRDRFKQITNPEGGVTQSFSEALLPYFLVQEIRLEFLETCNYIFSNTPPVLLSPVKSLNILLYQALRFQLPANLFYDKEDGYTKNLSVTALDQFFKPFNRSSWIQFDATTQQLYALPTSIVAKEQPTDGYDINIVAMDSHSNTANATIRIIVNDTFDAVNFVMEFNMAYNTSQKYQDIDLVLKFLDKVKAFLGNSGIIVTSYFKGNTTLRVGISAMNFRGLECNFAELQEIRRHLLLQENSSEIVGGRMNSTKPRHNFQPSKNFTRAMEPDFLILGVTEYKTGSCSNTPPILLHPIPHFVIPTHGFFSIVLPVRTFYDAEDGFTSNLSLTMFSSSGNILPPESWLQFNDTTDELYGVVTNRIKPNENYTFLLKAEDSYGLKANASFTVELTSRLQNIGFKMNVIFRSNFSSIVFHVDIMRLFLFKATSYFGGNISLEVLSYERGSGVPSTDILSWSVSELDYENCDLPLLHEISEKARSDNNHPNAEFGRALLPEFEILIVFEQRLGSCADALNSLPTVVVPTLSLNVTTIPTVFHYEVPRNVFSDAEDGDTRNLILTLLDEDNKVVLRNSSLQLDQSLQVLYGIFTESDLRTNSRVVKRDISSNSISMRFTLLATDSGGKTASSLLNINLENNIISQNFELYLTFTSYLSSTSPDVKHLINFQEKLNGFGAFRGMQVTSYVRSSGYPAKFQAGFINSTSDVNQSVCDFSVISGVTNTFQDSSKNLKSEFTARFLPEFVVQESYIQRHGPCLNPPNNPPRVAKVIPTIDITICEILKFQIPEDTFHDEDGNTRNLSLNLESVLPQNSEWVYFDHLSQIIYAVPTLNAVANQPDGGSIFKLTAVDSHGRNASIDLIVSVKDTILRDSYRTSAIVQVPSLVLSKENLVLKTIEFVEATERYLDSSMRNEIRVAEFTKISQSLLKVVWSYCSLRYSPCDYQNIERIRQATIHSGTLPHPRFIQSLAPALIVDSVEDEMRGPCLNQRPTVLHQLERLNITLCSSLLKYPIPYNTFFDKEDGYTPNLTLSLLSSTSTPLSDNYWITLDHSQTIVAYPNVDAFKSQPKSGYEFLINARDKYGLSTNLPIKIFHKGEIPQSTYEVTLVLQAKFGNMSRSVDQMRIILPALAGFMGGTEHLIRAHSFLRSGVNSTTSFFTWSNCSLDPSGCDILGITEISKRLRNDGKISEQLREAFRPNFDVQFVFEQRFGSCVDDTNHQPKAKHSLYQLTIKNFCGVWQFQIPSDFFHDTEDGGTRNLTLSLKTIHSLEISTDSWIQLKQENQTLYGFPAMSNSSNSSTTTREVYILIAGDSQGKFATMRLEIIFGDRTPDVHYGVLIKMSSYVAESIADVYHLKYFVEKLALFLKAETRSIMVTKYCRKTSASNSRLSVTWTNCSVAANSCDSNQIRIISEKFNLNTGDVDRTFSQSMLPYFVPNFITLEKYGLCRIEAEKSPPRLLRPIGRIFAYSGGLLTYALPKDAFVDSEDGNALNLSLKMQFTNKVTVPASYWLKFDNVSLVISGVLLVENAWKNSFRLVARDQHGNEAVDIFEVFLEQRCRPNLLSYKVFSEVVYAGNKEDINQRFLQKLEMYFQTWLTDTNFTILSTTSEGNNSFSIVWSHARTCGVCFKVNATLQSLSEKMTDSNGSALTGFKAALLPTFVLVNISEEKCQAKPGVLENVVKGGEKDRWKLYIVPIVVLLIFLLFSFIFFICRCVVFPYESKKQEVILADSPDNEIHVTDRISRSNASLYNSASTTIINDGYLGSNHAIDLPEIFLDKRVSPSKSSLTTDLSSGPIQSDKPTSTRDVVEPEPVLVPTPPLYSDAAVHLATKPDRKPRERHQANSAIEMHEIPVIKREVAPSSEAIPDHQSEVDGRPPVEMIQATRKPSPLSVPNDTWGAFDEEDDPIPRRNRLRLPTPPEVGTLRLPPVPKPLNNTPASSLGNSPSSPSNNTPNSPSPSVYSTPLQTPNYSQTTVNNTYNVRHTLTPSEAPTASPNSYANPPAYTEYPYGTPIRERSQLGIQSPISYGTPIRERTQLGIQSPLGFPLLQNRVPYIDHRQQRPTNEPRSNDLHEVLGQLRETVNRELDRRKDMDKYLESYLNRK